MKLQFIGDVFLDKTYEVAFPLSNFILNLEYPLSTNGIPAANKVNLGAQGIESLNKTFKKKPLAVNLANNHIMDFGEEAFTETIDLLEKENIKYFGAGKKSANFNNPLIIDFNGKKIALYAYCCLSTSPVIGNDNNYGAAPLEIELIETDLKKINDQKIDFKIVNLHWGDEEIKYPKPSDIQLAHKIVDLGADLIIGHHAHTIQSIEKYNAKNIFYGLGNFVFPDLDVPAGYDGEKFTKRYKKKQMKHNKYSMVVELNSDFSLNQLFSHFNNNKVILSNQKLDTQRLITNEKIYNLYVRYIKKKGTVYRFLKNPKMPTKQQIKIFIGLKP